MICCCGEALIDMLPRTLPGGEPVFLPVAGGSVFNTAIALGRLRAPTAMFTGLSTDLFGRQLEKALLAANVDVSRVHWSSRPTTLAFVTLEGGHAQYVFYDENTAGRSLSVGDLPGSMEDEALHFSGISLVVEPCAVAYEALAQRAAPDTVISLDPNIRPGFVTDAAAYRDRLERMIALADIIKVSDDDVEWLDAGAGFEGLASRWLGQGASIVVLTRGAHGAVAYTRNGPVEVAASPAAVIDTVGAGDTFNAGLLAGLRAGDMLEKRKLENARPEQVRPALELAAKAAAITVSRVGADPPWFEDIG